MVGTISIKVNAAKPEMPLPPCFSVKGSPTSIRIMDTPRAIGDWQITSVKLVMKYPNNITTAKNATRVGNVWVATVDGCNTVGKVSNGYEILADGKDEQNNTVQGYVLGRGNLVILDDDTDIARMVEKAAVRYLEELPTNPCTGDMVLFNGVMKFFDGEQWIGLGGVTEEEFNEFKEGVTASLSTIDSSLSVLSASVSTMGESISTISASISTLTSTKRDYTDKTWKYTKTTDPVMYGVKKFFLTRDEDGQQSHSYDLMDFDETTKVWSEYEAPITIKAYTPTLYAVIDENNPHTFEYDDEEYNGWEFYRINDSDTSFTVSGGGANIEYHITLTRRSDDTFAMESKVSEKRDYSDISWDYPMEQDSARFGIERFEVDFQGHVWNLNKFEQLNPTTKKWYSEGDSLGDRFTITTDDGRHYDLNDLTLSETYPFTRTGDGNVRWDIETSTMAYRVNAIRRQSGRLAIYEQDIDNPDHRILNFGQVSGAGIVICDNVSARTQAFVQIDDVMLTGNNYSSSRSVRLMKRGESSPHLKVNGSAVAFVNEVEAVSADVSTMTSSITTLETSVSSLEGSISAMGSSISTLGSYVSALASSMNGKRDYQDFTVQKSVDMRPYRNIRNFVDEYANSTLTMSNFGYTDTNRPTWCVGSSTKVYTDGWGQSYYFYRSGSLVASFTLGDLKKGEVTYDGGKIHANWGRGYNSFVMTINGMPWRLNKFTTSVGAAARLVWYDEGKNWSIEQTFTVTPNPSTTEQGTYSLYRGAYDGDHTLVGSFTDNSGMTDDTNWTETWTFEWESQTYTATFDIEGIRNWDGLAMTSQLETVTASVSALSSSIEAIASSLSNYATTSALGVVSASVSTMASSIDAMGSSVLTLGSSVSALASSMDGKRDYLDLTYSYSSASTVTLSFSAPDYDWTLNPSPWDYNIDHFVVSVSYSDPEGAWGDDADVHIPTSASWVGYVGSSTWSYQYGDTQVGWTDGNYDWQSGFIDDSLPAFAMDTFNPSYGDNIDEWYESPHPLMMYINIPVYDLAQLDPNTPYYQDDFNWEFDLRDLATNGSLTLTGQYGPISGLEYDFTITPVYKEETSTVEVNDTIALHGDLSAYATTSALSSYATVSALSSYATTSALSSYATTSYVDAQIGAMLSTQL